MAVCTADKCERNSPCAPGCPYFPYDKYRAEQVSEEMLSLKRREVKLLELLVKQKSS